MQHTIEVAGQGFVYRCPKCNRADRQPSFSNTTECRFCQHSFELTQTNDYSKKMKRIVDELISLETNQTHVDGKPVDLGYDPYWDKKTNLDSYFGRNNQSKFIEMAKTKEGMKILEKLITIISIKSVQELLDSTITIPNEFVSEAKMLVLIDKHKGKSLTPKQKVNILKKAGWEAYLSDKASIYHGEKKDGNICCVFFYSTVAPERDYVVAWE